VHKSGDIGSFPNQAFGEVAADETTGTGDQDIFILIADGHEFQVWSIGLKKAQRRQSAN
jgi:hypothetical protein